jgi:hypothetical protein
VSVSVPARVSSPLLPGSGFAAQQLINCSRKRCEKKHTPRKEKKEKKKKEKKRKNKKTNKTKNALVDVVLRRLRVVEVRRQQ